MGGQACVLYGAAEFSRDTDIAILASDENLTSLRAALRELQAKRIALPPFEPQYLRKGHAIHFRCHHPEAMNMRLDIMSVMRGVDPFEKLWQRRTTVEVSGGETFELLALSDLVSAKKTQRSKDWPMIRRLVEADYASQSDPSPTRVHFWLMESRTPEMLLELAHSFRDVALSLDERRPAIRHALRQDRNALEKALEEEQATEMEKDRNYWQPLRKELEELRRAGYPTEESV
jgi:hypothetical protein